MLNRYMISPPLQVISASSTTCNELLQCIFNLNPLDIEVYSVLVKDGTMRANEVGNKINRDRSTAYRCLQHLMTCNICYKEQKYLDKGGYYYLYSAEPPEEVKNKLEVCMENWHERMKMAVEEFVDKFRT